MEHELWEVDVFTTRPLMGNPVAIVFGAGGFDEDKMAQLARWTNFSETVFVTGVESDAYDVRIFSPRGELSFAGHPSVGTAYALRRKQAFSHETSRVTQRSGVGPAPIDFLDDAVFVRVPEPRVSEVSTIESEITEALRASRVAEPLRVNVGPAWITGRIDTLAELRGLEPNSEALRALSQSVSATGVTVYAVEGALVEVRSFAPLEGIDEDPVCGSGNACVATHLQRTGGLDALGNRYEARQGAALQRDGHVRVRVEEDGVWIGGACCVVVKGTLCV